jgi:hypothetical protein
VTREKEEAMTVVTFVAQRGDPLAERALELVPGTDGVEEQIEVRTRLLGNGDGLPRGITVALFTGDEEAARFYPGSYLRMAAHRIASPSWAEATPLVVALKPLLHGRKEGVGLTQAVQDMVRSYASWLVAPKAAAPWGPPLPIPAPAYMEEFAAWSKKATDLLGTVLTITSLGGGHQNPLATWDYFRVSVAAEALKVWKCVFYWHDADGQNARAMNHIEEIFWTDPEGGVVVARRKEGSNVHTLHQVVFPSGEQLDIVGPSSWLKANLDLVPEAVYRAYQALWEWYLEQPWLKAEMRERGEQMMEYAERFRRGEWNFVGFLTSLLASMTMRPLPPIQSMLQHLGEENGRLCPWMKRFPHTGGRATYFDILLEERAYHRQEPSATEREQERWGIVPKAVPLYAWLRNELSLVHGGIAYAGNAMRQTDDLKLHPQVFVTVPTPEQALAPKEGEEDDYQEIELPKGLGFDTPLNLWILGGKEAVNRVLEGATVVTMP